MSAPEWEIEDVPVVFEAHGLPCLIVRHSFGALCGYVKLPHAHPLYGVACSDPAPEALKLAVEAAKNSPIGKRGVFNLVLLAAGSDFSAGDLFDVHGSITFSGCPHSEELPQEGFWYGFDCSHAGDLSPHTMFRIGNETYRNLGAECESLALQLSRLQALVS